ncbi:MAG: hypothetical protein ACRC6T_11210 [Sarcina sp.]
MIKNNKNNIIRFILAFSIVAVFIYVSSVLFGNGGRSFVMMGMMTLFLIFMMDNKKGMYKNILKMLGIIIPSIILGYIGNFNIYLELCINLVWVSILIYSSIKYLKLQMYLPLLLIYIISFTFNHNISKVVPSYIAVAVAIAIACGVKAISENISNKRNSLRTINDFIKGFKIEDDNSSNKEKLVFSIRIAILVSAISFIIHLFNLPYGDWTLFGVIAMFYPYIGLSKGVDKDIVIGSLMGVIRILIIVTVVPLYPVRMGIMGMGFYYFLSSKKPRVRAMGGIMFVLSMTEIGKFFGGINLYILGQRIIFIIIAIVISIIINKIIEYYARKKVLKEAF